MSQKTENISHGFLLIGLGVLAMTHNWWPNLLLVLGLFFSLRNFLNRNYTRGFTSLLIYGGVYLCLQYPFFISWEFILPLTLFTLGLERILGEFFSIRKKRN